MSLNKLLASALIVQLLILGGLVLAPHQAQSQLVSANQKDPTPPDPNRPYYDLWGNQFSYDGKLLHAACPNVPDPISGKGNPYCAPQPEPADFGGK